MVTINSIDITESDINDLIKKLRNWALESIDWSQFEKFEFQGFDPETTVASFISCQKKMSLKSDMLENDIITLVGIGIMKGNITAKNKKRMSSEGIKAYDILVARYAIATNPRGKSASVITIPRTVAAFAGLAVRMVNKMGPKKYPGKSFHSNELPYFMQITCFPSIIPKSMDDKIKEFLLIANLCYSMDLSITVADIKDVKTIENLIPDQRKFVDLAHSSKVPGEKSRMGLITELNLADHYKAIANVVSQYKLFKPDYTLPSPAEFSTEVKAQYVKGKSVAPAVSQTTILDD